MNQTARGGEMSHDFCVFRMTSGVEDLKWERKGKDRDYIAYEDTWRQHDQDDVFHVVT